MSKTGRVKERFGNTRLGRVGKAGDERIGLAIGIFEVDIDHSHTTRWRRRGNKPGVHNGHVRCRVAVNLDDRVGDEIRPGNGDLRSTRLRSRC